MSSFTPIIPAVSSKSFGVMRSTKSSKSTLPPTGVKIQKTQNMSSHLSSRSLYFCQLPHSSAPGKLTVHVDVLTQLNQLHLCGHVAHRPHEIPQVLTTDQPVLVLIKLIEGITQLCGEKPVSVRALGARSARCTCRKQKITSRRIFLKSGCVVAAEYGKSLANR